MPPSLLLAVGGTPGLRPRDLGQPMMSRRVARLAHGLPRPLRRALKRAPGVDRLRRAMSGSPRGTGAARGSLRPVVYLPTWLTWTGMRQRPQYLLSALAEAGHPTFFVDPRARGESFADGVRIVPSLRGVPADHPILYVHFAPVVRSFELFREPVVIYDILDDLSIYDPDEVGLPEERRVGFHHPAVMHRADVVIASSQTLLDRHLAERGDLLLVENGVDAERFAAPMSRPVDLPLGRPLIGYHGAIAPWFDFDLLEHVARRRPDWDFALVGPTLGPIHDRVASLSRLENIHLLGERPSDTMPAYVQAFDVGTIPFMVDRLTEGVSPLKMFEYLAAGKPVVATPLPACVASSAVVTATGPDQWIAAIEKALSPSDPEPRRAAAAIATWDRRLAPLVSRLDAAGLRRVPE